MSTSNFDFTSQMVSIKDIARNYKAIFARVNRDKKPLMVFNRTKPQVVILDAETYKKAEKKKQREWEEKDAMKAIAEYEKAKKAGKLLTFNGKTF